MSYDFTNFDAFEYLNSIAAASVRTEAGHGSVTDNLICLVNTTEIWVLETLEETKKS